MDEMQKIHHNFLMDQHEKMCFGYGEHHEEFTSPYSAGADAIERMASIDLDPAPITSA